MLPNLVSALISGCQALTWTENQFFFFFFEASALLDVRYYPKLQSCALSRKTNDANLRKWQKT